MRACVFAVLLAQAMPKYNREEWLAGLKQVKFIKKALQKKAKEEAPDPYEIKGELDEESKAYYVKISEVFEKGAKEGMISTFWPHLSVHISLMNRN